jgi:Ca2+-binding EF-hand superfamily protein
MEYEKVFNFLDKNKRKKIFADDVIIGLGALGKICSLEERRKIEEETKYYDLESFINICKELVDFNNMENNLQSFLLSFESKEKPGYIKKEKIVSIIKKFDFDRYLRDKKINELIREVSRDNNDDYINIDTLVKEFLDK